MMNGSHFLWIRANIIILNPDFHVSVIPSSCQGTKVLAGKI